MKMTTRYAPLAYDQETQNFSPASLRESQNQERSIQVSLQDIWELLGIRGSGKTTFGQHLLVNLARMYPHARRYILDSNGRGDFADWSGRIEQEHAPRPDEGMRWWERFLGGRRGGFQQVWAPGNDDLGEYDRWFEGILRERESAIVFVDELSSIVSLRGEKFPDNFARLLKQGRVVDLEQDKHICVVIGTQEQSHMPRQVLGQATHVCRWRLQNEYDARFVESAIGITERLPQPGSEHGFFYVRADRPTDVWEYDDLNQFFGGLAA